MLVHDSAARSYLFTALDSNPNICSYLLHGVSVEEADFSPDPTRFTIREVVAHLAEWDTIFLARMKQTLAQDTPTLLEFDEGELAIEHDYAHSNIAEQLRLFRDRRTLLLDFLRPLSPHQWERDCYHPRIGPMSMEALATLVALHDAYHLRQLTEWRRTFAISQNILD